MNFSAKFLAFALLSLHAANAEEVGERWGTADKEREYYPLVDVPIPKELVIEAGALHQSRIPEAAALLLVAAAVSFVVFLGCVGTGLT
jgi:hypothetical protein